MIKKDQTTGNIGNEVKIVLLDKCLLLVLKTENTIICGCFLQGLQQLKVVNACRQSVDNCVKHFKRLEENTGFCKKTGCGIRSFAR
jgi:hypothetical protein